MCERNSIFSSSSKRKRSESQDEALPEFVHPKRSRTETKTTSGHQLTTSPTIDSFHFNQSTHHPTSSRLNPGDSTTIDETIESSNLDDSRSKSKKKKKKIKREHSDTVTSEHLETSGAVDISTIQGPTHLDSSNLDESTPKRRKKSKKSKRSDEEPSLPILDLAQVKAETHEIVSHGFLVKVEPEEIAPLSPSQSSDSAIGSLTNGLETVNLKQKVENYLDNSVVIDAIPSKKHKKKKRIKQEVDS